MALRYGAPSDTNLLTTIMPGYAPPVSELWLICPTRQSITPAMRLLRDDLRAKVGELMNAMIAGGFFPPDRLSEGKDEQPVASFRMMIDISRPN
ncbi:hypothetical protein [Marinobacter sp.]|uniref:hypothetical protein n=1 Tax=Marinobacter sp. TaxID=50741 RepID=UPI003B52A90C